MRARSERPPGDNPGLAKPQRSCVPRPASGFGLIEILVVLALLALLAAFGIPALHKLFLQAKLTAAAHEVATHVLRSRVEAVKLARSVVVAPDYDSLDLVSWVDENDNQLFDPGSDAEIYRLRAPGSGGQRGIFFMGPDGPAGTFSAPAGSVEGFTPVGSSDFRVIVFDPDGSVRNPGALRISDLGSPRRNVLEVRVAPQATARVEVRKYIYEQLAYRPMGAGLWEWY
jgi:prepilin-type N-terminal cleavage/methylation domain-containing protein